MNKSSISIAILLNKISVNKETKKDNIYNSNKNTNLQFHTILNNQIKLLLEHFNDVFIVSNTPLELIDLDIEIISEVYEKNHYLSKIHSALIHSKHQNCLILSKELFPIELNIIDEIIKNFKKNDICNIAFEKEIDYLGIYSKKSILHLDHMLSNNLMKLSDLKKRVKSNIIKIP